MFRRIISRPKSHSFFLFGARGTGKSTWLKETAFRSDSVHWIDLLDYATENQLALDPSLFDRQLEQLPRVTKWVVIDEVQKIPRLLDLVHRWIERKRFHFALTGSSARKLKRGDANLLAGRAFLYHLYPLTHRELGDRFQLREVLQFGSLPKIFSLETDQEKAKFLQSYTQTYLKEEIVAEQLVRKITPFRKFLELAAQSSGQIINYSNIAQEIGVDRVSVQTYFQILEETLVGRILEPYHRSVRKRQRQNPKFYFFDTGVLHSLEGRVQISPQPKTADFGRAFEHFIINEIMRLSDYLEKEYRFSYLRTKDNVEIDLIIERPGKGPALVEIKSNTNIRDRDVASLNRLAKDIRRAEAYCFSLDPLAKKFGDVTAVPWQKGIEALGLGESV